MLHFNFVHLTFTLVPLFITETLTASKKQKAPGEKVLNFSFYADQKHHMSGSGKQQNKEVVTQHYSKSLILKMKERPFLRTDLALQYSDWSFSKLSDSLNIGNLPVVIGDIIQLF